MKYLETNLPGQQTAFLFTGPLSCTLHAATQPATEENTALVGDVRCYKTIWHSFGIFRKLRLETKLDAR